MWTEASEAVLCARAAGSSVSNTALRVCNVATSARSCETSLSKATFRSCKKVPTDGIVEEIGLAWLI